MSDYTFQIQGVPTGTAPLDYKVSGDQKFNLTAIRALFDGTAAASGFLPCVQILSPAGSVMVETIGTVVSGGGSADASFFPLRRSPASTSSGYAGAVASVGPAGTLRQYLRLGELASPFADTSGYVNGPSNATRTAQATAYTTHVAGALQGGQDDGALQFNAVISNGDYLQSGAGALNPSINQGVTLVGWFYPFPSVSNWRGGIYGSQSVVAGSPSHEEGWCLDAVWSGGNVTGRMTRAINNVPLSAGNALPTNTWTMLMGTYDGATIQCSANGNAFVTQADARADTNTNYGNLTVDHIVYSTLATVGQFYGVVDELACWGAVLTQANAQTLYAAAFG